MLRRVARIIWTFACLVGWSGTPAAAQVIPPFGSGFMILGRDTVGIEQWAIRGDTVSAVTLWRDGGTVLTRYSVVLGADGLPVSARYSHDYGARLPADSGRLVWDHAARRLHWHTADSTRTLPFPATPIFPLGAYFADYLIQARRLRTTDSVAFVYLSLADGTLRPARARHLEAGRFRIEHIAVVDEFTVLPDGSLRHDVSLPTKVFLRESAPIDREPDAVRLLAQDVRTGGLGTLSPRDSASALVGTLRLVVDYGAPARRGRQIWGTVVDWNRVWRAGANLATHLRINEAVSLGGHHLPAGTYTLWMQPSETDWLLIVSAETGQWGTRYNPSHDLFRVPMEVSRSEPAERLRYFFEESGGHHYLGLVWDDRRVRIRFESLQARPPG